MSVQFKAVQNLQPSHHAPKARVEGQLQPQAANVAADSEDPETLAFAGLAGGATAANSNPQHEYQTHNLQQVAAPLQKSGNVFSLFGNPPPNVPPHIRDIETLSEGKLKQKYKSEYESWRNRRDAAKRDTLPWHKPWDSFAMFLRHHGPKPDPTYTLDKINAELGYVPNNTRWADKKTQAWNRDATNFITHQGETLPIAEWARRTGIPESTIRNRHARSWPAEAIFATEAAPAIARRSRGAMYRRWPAGFAEQWEQQYQHDTGGQGDYAKFMLMRCEKELKAMTDELDGFSYPDDYDPTPQELQDLAKFTARYERWQGFRLHAQQLLAHKQRRQTMSP